MADFEEMVKVGQHGIDFILGMVLNHCSIEHMSGSQTGWDSHLSGLFYLAR